MGTLLTILITLLVISAIITILLVLLQDDQGSGMGLFGSSGQSPFSTGDSFLGKLTRIFSISFLVLCLAVAFVISRFGVNYDALQQAQGEFENQNQSSEEPWFLKNPDIESDAESEVQSDSQSDAQPAADALETDKASDAPAAEASVEPLSGEDEAPPAPDSTE